jgi:glycosyltransferase involved in cell wall biosynthesis
MPGEIAVTVLMAVYNEARFAPAAVESILGQTFTDFEFLIIDDGSTDSSADYLRNLRDPRVRLLRNAGNLGLTRSLNKGLDAARGTYLARMDADDIAQPDRLARQVAFLDASPHIGIFGSSRILIDENNNEIAVAHAAEDDLAIRWKCLLGNPFAHPTVMLRRAIFDQHHLRYDESFRTAQDYELWSRLLTHTQGTNLREPLLRYRLRDGMSKTCKPEQLANHDRIALAACARLLPGFPVSAQDVTNLRGRFGGFSVRDAAMDPADRIWLEKYRKMFDAFAEANADRPGIDAVRSHLEFPSTGMPGEG